MAIANVSVIVPVFKVEDYLFQCLKSITDQTLHNIEIILVDEGENDTCYAIMCYFAEIDSRVKIIHRYHGGYGASVNAGIKAANGKYIVIVKSDDFIEKTMLEDLYRVAEETEADFVKTPFYEFYDASKSTPSYKKDCFRREQFAFFSVKPFTLSEHPEILCDHAAIWAALYRRNFLLDNNIFFHEAKGAGYVDLNFRLDTYLQAKKIVWLDQPYYNWRITNIASSTQAKNVTDMLTRWVEACTQLSNEQKTEIVDIIAPALIHELYWTAIDWIKQQQTISVEQADMLEKVMAFFTNKHISQSKFIDSRIRKELLLIKHHADQHKIYELYSALPTTILGKLTFDIHLSHNRFFIHLLPRLKKNYFSQQLILFNIFSIKIIVGQV